MNELPIVLLSGRRFPELAEVVRASSTEVLRRWSHVARQTMPKADEITFTELRDNLPVVLEQLARALESDQEPEARFIGDLTAEHRAQRFHLHYNLNELLQEYSILRPIFFQEVSGRLGRALSLDEMNALNVGLDISVRRAVVAFVDHQARQLQNATEAQSKYLSFLSHDLRGGLNGVFLMIEVLKRELAGEERLAETVEDLNSMRRSLLETVGTMDRFLHAERFRKGKVSVKPSPLGVRALVGEAVSHFIYQAKDKGLEIKVEVPDEYSIVSDREMLTLVLQNLLSNAVKYTRKGAVVVGAKHADGGVLLWVRDDGPGIAPDKLADLFSAFTRGDTHGQPGVGLGLSIASQAAKYLDAKLWAESEPDRGATFFLRLPGELRAKEE